MHDDQLLDLGRIDIVPAGDDHEILAIGNLEIPRLIDPAHVAERHPAAVIIGARGLRRVLVIFHRGSVGEIDMADLARRQRLAIAVQDMEVAKNRAADRYRASEGAGAIDRSIDNHHGPYLTIPNQRTQPHTPTLLE